MASKKELKFQFDLDENSFNRVKSALDQMIQKTQQLQKAMSGIGQGGGGSGLLSGGNTGRAPSGAQQVAGGGAHKAQTSSIGSAILKDVDAFQKLAKSGSTAMGAMTEAVRKAVRDQSNELNRIDGIIGRINSKYDTMNDKQAAI